MVEKRNTKKRVEGCCWVENEANYTKDRDIKTRW